MTNLVNWLVIPHADRKATCSTAEILAIIKANQFLAKDFREIHGDHGDASSLRRLGRAMARHEGMILNRFAIARSKTRTSVTHSVLWTIEPAT